MKITLALTLLCFSAISARADDPAAPVPLPGGAVQNDRPDPRLVALEQELSRKLIEPDLDRSSPEYLRFAENFRIRLGAGMRESPQTSADKRLHARILSRLDEAGVQQAEEGLNAWLARNPSDHGLRLSLGLVQAQKGDYADAAETARAVLDFQGEPRPSPQQLSEARSLWLSTKGRGAGAEAAPAPTRSAAAVQVGGPGIGNDRPAVLAVDAGRATPSDVPAAMSEGQDAANPPASSPFWPWPAGWGLTLIGGAWALKKKLDDENLTGPIAMTGAGVALLGISTMFPPAAVLAAPGGINLIVAPAVAQAAAGTVGSALTAKGAVDTAQALLSRARGDPNASTRERSGVESNAEGSAQGTGNHGRRIDFQTEHAKPHFKGLKTAQAEIETAIRNQLVDQLTQAKTSFRGSFNGRIVVNGQRFEYRGFGHPDGTLNIGTIYPIP